MKVGCFGGSFDPIHEGHLAAARFVLNECQLDEIWFIPTQDTPLKERALSSFEHRKKMIELMLEKEGNMKCCDIEATLPSPSYTIQTVEALKEKNPQIQFYWIIGDDLVQQLQHWKSIEQLKKEVQFVVVSRENEEKDMDYSLIYVKNFNHPASSTQIREGNFVHLKKEVRDYIVQHGLYLEDIVRFQCSDHRARHSISTASMALELAENYSILKWKVYFAAILHDVCKNKSDEELMKWMSSRDIKTIEDKKYLWHAYAAKEWIKTNLLVEDEDILSAIENHTEGSDESLLGMIIYLADKLERERKVYDEKYVQLAKEDIQSAFKKVKEEIKQWRKS